MTSTVGQDSATRLHAGSIQSGSEAAGSTGRSPLSASPAELRARFETALAKADGADANGEAGARSRAAAGDGGDVEVRATRPTAGDGRSASAAVEAQDEPAAAVLPAGVPWSIATWPVACVVPIEPTGALTAPAPVSATAAAAQRVQAAPRIEPGAPWQLAFGEREVAATGVAGLVVTPGGGALPPSLRVVATAAMQPALALRIDGLRARLAERGITGMADDEIVVSAQEGDDESKG